MPKKVKTKSNSKSTARRGNKKTTSPKVDRDEEVPVTAPESEDQNIENQNFEDELILNEDTLDLLEGMTEKLEETTDMAEKVKLHAEISRMTADIKGLIHGLIQDVDAAKIMVEPAAVNPDELEPDGDFDVMIGIHSLESELGEMNETDDLRERVKIYTQMRQKCAVLKRAADNGDLIIRKCN
jgi:hypothetical protein